ncbi:MAG: glycoside hydrolase family 3 protein [Alphaproteobacteria bacterium]|nr:MAG: glycoside hydrolase family 3 protein [Alphaproteobacteria bacterium]
MTAHFTLGRSTRMVALACLMLSGAGVAYTAAAADPAAWPRVESSVAQDRAVEARVAEILKRMSLEEKVGQILQVEIQYITPEDIRKYHVGSVLNGGGSLPNRNKYATPGEWLALADSFYEASMDTSDGGVAIPIIWGSDAVHGHNNVIGATLFPHNVGLGAMHDPALMQKVGEVTALEVRATGIDWTFAPTIAVARNDRWGRTYESYSEDPALVKSYAGAVVTGLQGKSGTSEFLDVNHVVATAKHFLGDGGTDGGDDQGDAKMSEQELRDIHGAGYVTAIEAGVQTVMASFSSWNGTKMHGNKYMLTDVLKDRMGFDGFVVGDWNGHGQVPGCTNASCPTAVNAGLDLFMVIEDWKQLYANTLDQVKSGVIPVARLDDAVSRILRVKLRAGLFDKGKPSARGVAGQDDIIGRPENRAIARQAVRESLVLLKNAGHVLPIAPKSTILVAGDAADNIGKQSGGWTISWQGDGNVNSDFPGATSIYAGIRDAAAEAGGTAILSVDGSYDKKPDVAVVVFGENPYAEGQGDIETVEFEPGNKQSLALLKKLKADGIPVVSVFLSGRPMWVNPEINASDAFVAAWLPGTEGAGVADVLVAGADGTARHDFTGRLSFSWPKTPLQDELNKGKPGYDPQFALGYGLDYAGAGVGPGLLAEDVAGVKSASLEDLHLFAGRAYGPWLVKIQDAHNTQQISGSYAALPSGAAKASLVDKDVQGDAIRLEWLKDAPVSLIMSDGPAFDWTAYAAAGAEISFDLNIVDAPEGDVTLALRCGEGCERSVVLNPMLEGAEGAGWKTVSVPLVCFADGQDFSRISEPFRLGTSGPAEMVVANISLNISGPSSQGCPLR